MTTLTTSPAVTDAGYTDKVAAFLEEAVNGPVGSGSAGTVRVQDVTLDVCASQGWGVRFSRSLPGDRVETRHLAGDRLTLEAAGEAIGELLRLTA